MLSAQARDYPFERMFDERRKRVQTAKSRRDRKKNALNAKKLFKQIRTADSSLRISFVDHSMNVFFLLCILLSTCLKPFEANIAT